MPNVTSVLLVGYSVKAREDLTGLVAGWPASLTEEEQAVPATVEAAQAKMAEIRSQIRDDALVHLCQLARVVIIDPQTSQVFDSQIGDPKDAALTTASWLMDNYRDAWGATPFDYQAGPPRVSFYGFDMKLFLKMLGLEAARMGFSLPPNLWYANSDHRDMEGALLPTGCVAKKFTLRQAMLAMGILEQIPGGLPETWQPRQDPAVDARVSSEIAVRLGLIPRKKTEKIAKPKASKAAAK